MGEQLWGGGCFFGFPNAVNEFQTQSQWKIFNLLGLHLFGKWFFFFKFKPDCHCSWKVLVTVCHVCLSTPPPIINGIVALKTQLWLFTICQLMFSDLSTQHMQQKVCRQLLKALKQAFAVFAPPLPFKKWGLKSWNSATSNKIPANHIECVGKR